MDSNGDIGINGGKIIVYEASTGADQLIDRDGEFKITAETVFVEGSNEMEGGISVKNSHAYAIYTSTIEEGKIYYYYW